MFSICQLLSHRWKLYQSLCNTWKCTESGLLKKYRCCFCKKGTHRAAASNILRSPPLLLCWARNVKGVEFQPQEWGGCPFLLGALPLLLAQTTVAGARYCVVKTLSFKPFSLLCYVNILTSAQFSDPVLSMRSIQQISNTLSLTNVTPKYSHCLNIYIF